MDDLISRQAAIDATAEYLRDMAKIDNPSLPMSIDGWKPLAEKIFDKVPSAQPEYFDYTDIDEAWEYYAKEHDANLTDNAKQLKDAMWVGYQKGKQDAQPEPSTEIQEILDYLDTTLHPIVSPDNWDVYAELHDMVSMLPSAQPEQRWIPCSERLPETPTGNKDYEWDGEDIAADEYIVMIKNAKHPTSLWWTDKEWIDVYAYESYCVIAWMPLPEPYEDFSEHMNEPEEE